MTNFEKYKDAILFIANGGEKPALAKGGLAECIKTNCEECKFCVIDGSCTANLIKWLYEEYKEPAPKLTSKERAFCEAICDDYAEIQRDADGKLWLIAVTDTAIRLHTKQFNFIQNRCTWMITSLLKLEVE